MSKFGGWNVNVPVRDKLPQKIATAMSEFTLEPRFGAEYKFKSYLATQQVNGTNHALLMEQTIFSGKDTVNAVVVVFNEKPGVEDVAVSDIRRIIEAGGQFGGNIVAISNEIPQEAKDAFNTAMNGFTGSKINPFMYLSSKVTKGTEYKLLAEVTPVVTNPKTDLAIVTVNSMEHSIFFERVFERSSAEESLLGYWIVKGVKQRAVRLGTTLTEWP